MSQYFIQRTQRKGLMVVNLGIPCRLKIDCLKKPLDEGLRNQIPHEKLFSSSMVSEALIKGGAYIFGNAKLYRSLTGVLAKNTGHPVLAINYRRAPEYPFPAGLHDALAAYIWLLQPDNPMFLSQDSHHEPYRPCDIIISGDSGKIDILI